MEKNVEDKFKQVSTWLKEKGLNQYIEPCRHHGISSLREFHELLTSPTEKNKHILQDMFPTTKKDQKNKEKIKSDLTKLTVRMDRESRRHLHPVASSDGPFEMNSVKNDFLLLDFVSVRRFVEGCSVLDPGVSKLDHSISLLSKISNLWSEVEQLGFDATMYKNTGTYSKKALEMMESNLQAKPGMFSPNLTCFSALIALLEEYEKSLFRIIFRRRNVLPNFYRRRLFAVYNAHLRCYISQAQKKTNNLPSYLEVKQKSNDSLLKIQDPKLKEMWTNFVEQNFHDVDLISWEAFFQAYEKALKVQIDIDTENILKQLVTQCGVNYVALEQAIHFVDAFGPLEVSLEKAKHMWTQPYFYPFCSPVDVDTFLIDQPIGTFLVRFSFEQNSYFAIDYVISPGKVRTLLVHYQSGSVHVRRVTKNRKAVVDLVTTLKLINEVENMDLDVPTKGQADVGVAPLDGQSEKYASLEELLETFPEVFGIPFVSDCISQPWFLGDLLEEEVIDLLDPSPPGTFLLHYDQQGERGTSLLCSYKMNSQTRDIGHVGITKVSDAFLFVPQNTKQVVREGFSINFDKETYSKLESFIRAHCETLRYNHDPENVPGLPVATIENDSFKLELMGPEKENKGCRLEQKSRISCQSWCTYPASSEGWKVLCDQFHVKCVGDRTIFAVADGCSWGKRSRMAAYLAAKECVDYVSSERVQEDIKTLVDCKNHLLRSFRLAHTKIIEEWVKVNDLWSAGQSTLLAGMVLPIDSPFICTEWAFICVSVGDCKAFFWDEQSGCFDITYGNRTNVFDPRDSGGRVGPYADGGLPDLRNLSCYFYPCKPGDIIIAISDGVYDNLDPEHLGQEPVDLRLPEYKNWDQMPIPLATEVKSKFMCYKINQLFSKCKDKSPLELNQTLIDYCFQITGNSRAYMETHPNSPEPTGFSEFPGKMDHVTAVVLRIGPMWDEMEIRRHKRRNKQSKKLPLSRREERRLILHGINKTIIRKYTNDEEYNDDDFLYGPLHDQIHVMGSKFGAAQSISTLPFMTVSKASGSSGTETRGAYALHVSPYRTTGVLSSGQKHGEKSDMMLECLCEVWLRYMLSHHVALEDTLEVAETCLDAMVAANKAIQKDVYDGFSLLLPELVEMFGLVCCRLPNLEANNECGWFLLCMNSGAKSETVGNIKAFVWNAKTHELTDVCAKSNEVSNQSVVIHSHVIKDDSNTFIIVMSPEAYHNFDPLYLGKKPRDYSLPNKNWDKMEDTRAKIMLEDLVTVLRPVTSNLSEELLETLTSNIKIKTEERCESYTKFSRRSRMLSSDTLEHVISTGVLNQATILCFQVSNMKSHSKSSPKLTSNPSISKLASPEIPKLFVDLTLPDKENESKSHRDLTYREDDPPPPSYIPDPPEKKLQPHLSINHTDIEDDPPPPSYIPEPPCNPATTEKNKHKEKGKKKRNGFSIGPINLSKADIPSFPHSDRDEVDSSEEK